MTKAQRRIFIVEDEVLVAFEMTEILEDMGFEVVGPSVHLADAEEKAQSLAIDIAFLDVNLGGDLTSEPIADILRSRGIPFAYITAYDAKQVGFLRDDDKVVNKPVSGEVLSNLLQEVLPS